MVSLNIAGGLHTPEHAFFEPVFVDGSPIGLAVAIGHVCEVGGTGRPRASQAKRQKRVMKACACQR
jgi:N-methylhydantoinase B/oxoprolinase/acetone carboxylase alpha subunit